METEDKGGSLTTSEDSEATTVSASKVDELESEPSSKDESEEETGEAASEWTSRWKNSLVSDERGDALELPLKLLDTRA